MLFLSHPVEPEPVELVSVRVDVGIMLHVHRGEGNQSSLRKYKVIIKTETVTSNETPSCHCVQC